MLGHRADSIAGIQSNATYILTRIGSSIHILIGYAIYISPLPFLLGTLLSLASLAVLVGGIYLVWAWFVGTLVATSSLVYGLVMAWSLLGRYIVLAFYPHGKDKPQHVESANARPIEAADGSRLHVEFDGPPDGPVIILTHGWALDSAAWYSVRRELAKTNRLVLWDLPGLGKSS